jgi:serine/threonine protein kinase
VTDPLVRSRYDIATPDSYVGPYRLVRQLGEGGMGVVHLAVAPDSQRVALKQLRPHVVGDAEGRNRLAREIAAMRRVEHPRVAPCLDGDPWGSVPYVVTRFVAGSTLAEHVLDAGPLAGEDLRALAIGLAEAIAAVHRVGVLHRDIKPSNVLIERGEPVLIDFGLAMAGDESRMTYAGSLLGTPAYLAPESVFGDEPSAAADVYGWAATVVFACTGRGPVGGGPTLAVLERVRRGEVDLHGVPEDLRPLIASCLAGDPLLRPSSDQVLAWLAAHPVEDAGSTAWPNPPRYGQAPPAPTTPLTAGTPPTTASAHVGSGASPIRPQSSLARWLTGAGWVSALVGVLAAAPLLATALVFSAMVIAQTAGRVDFARCRRQERRGVRRSDAARSLAGWPWHLVASLPSTAFTIGCGALIAALAVQVGVSTGAQIRDSLVAGSALCVLTWWRGPFESRHAAARRHLVSVTTSPPRSRWVWCLLLVLLTLAALTLQQAVGPLWWPLAAAPSLP